MRTVTLTIGITLAVLAGTLEAVNQAIAGTLLDRLIEHRARR